MKNFSIFKDNQVRDKFVSQTVSSDLECDVLIIGGGLTGISTYYHLQDDDLKIILVDQNEIGMSTTGNSTGKITYLQDSIYNKLINNFGNKIASQYLNSQLTAIDILLNTIEKYKLKCDLETTNSYVYSNKIKERKKLRELQRFLTKNNLDSKLIEKDNETTIIANDTYLFNPIKFIYELINKANLKNIYEYSSIKEIKKCHDYYDCFLDKYCIKAKYVIIASHYPYFIIPYLFPIKSKLEKSYICAGKKKMDNISMISYSYPFFSMRNYQDYMLYLRGSHNTSCKVNDQKHFDKLLNAVKKYQLNVEYLWSNIDIITNDYLPLIGNLEENIYIATGYNTWGMTNGFLAGSILADLINKRDNKYMSLFDPHRLSIYNPVEVVKNGFFSAKGLAEGILNKNDNIEYKTINGQEVAIYHDESGEHVVLRKCPHMKCHLLFNEKEMTWDCPCHASRFDIDGKCISGPSNQNISFNSKN